MSKLVVKSYEGDKPVCDFVHDSGEVNSGLKGVKQGNGAYSVKVEQYCTGKKWHSIGKNPEIGKEFEFQQFSDEKSKESKELSQDIRAKSKVKEAPVTITLMYLTDEEKVQWDEAKATIERLTILNRERATVKNVTETLNALSPEVVAQILEALKKTEESKVE